MTEEPDREELIDSYLLGRLDEKSLAEFRELVERDNDFKEALEAQTLMYHGVRGAARLQLKERLRSIHRGMTSGKEEARPVVALKTNFSIRQRVWLGAASVIAIVATALLVNNGFRPKTETLFREYFTAYPVLNGTTRGGAEAAQTPVQQFTAAYGAGNYTAAVNLFRAVPDSNRTGAVYLYLGNAYLGSGQADSAVAIFSSSDALDEKFAPEKKWYLGLSLLKQGKKVEAKRILQSLSQQPGPYQKNAGELLHKLNQ